MRIQILLPFLLSCVSFSVAQQKESTDTPAQTTEVKGKLPDAPSKTSEKPKEPASPPVDEKPVVTHHEVKAGGKTLRYTTTTGFMPIKNAEGETEAHIFFMAYTLDQPAGA